MTILFYPAAINHTFYFDILLDLNKYHKLLSPHYNIQDNLNPMDFSVKTNYRGGQNPSSNLNYCSNFLQDAQEVAWNMFYVHLLCKIWTLYFKEPNTIIIIHNNVIDISFISFLKPFFRYDH